jgi:hypothetical protein
MTKIEPWHRRHAIQMAAALPPETEDALLVLALTRELVESFLQEPEAIPRPASVVLLRRGDDCA